MAAVSSTLALVQNEAALPLVMLAVGALLEVTDVAGEVALHPPLVIFTV